MPDPSRKRADGYADRSANARLAAALLAAETWTQKLGLTSSAIRDLFTHLWEWPTVTEETFRDWERWSNDALEAALGGPLSPELAEAARVAGASGDDLAHVLEDVSEIVYSNLFGAVDNEESLRHLRRLETTLRRYDIVLPPAMLFDDEPFTERGGWGKRETAAEIAEWRRRLESATS